MARGAARRPSSRDVPGPRSRVVMEREILRGITLTIRIEAVAFFLVLAVLLDILIMPWALGTRPTLQQHDVHGVLHSITVAGARHSSGIEQLLGTAAITALVVLATLAHELGHALALRDAGATDITITIYGAGGTCRAQALDTSPLALMWYAAAGPLVTIGVVVALALTHGSVKPVSYDAHAVLWLTAAIEAGTLALNILPLLKKSDGGHFLSSAADLFGHSLAVRLLLDCALCVLIVELFASLQSGQIAARLSAAAAIFLCATLARVAWRADQRARIAVGAPRRLAVGKTITWW